MTSLLLSSLLSLAVLGIATPDYEILVLPGSVADPRAMPNLPLSVDSNRLSDGVSSTSPLTTTAPSYPAYHGTTDSTVDARSVTAQNVATSRAEQGIGPRGAGEFERDAARFILLEENGGAVPSAPTATFSVEANKWWNPSGYAIQADEVYRVEVLDGGAWYDGEMGLDLPLTADGYDAYFDVIHDCWMAEGECRPHLLTSKPRLPPPKAKWFQLVCGTCNAVTKLKEASLGHERFLPIDESDLIASLIPIGTDRTFVARSAGELICAANDASTLYSVNQGQVQVRVTRVSWPPSSEFDANYQTLLESDGLSGLFT
ncbi:unnamed protein product [Chrysoparadoxa australica]